MDSSEVIHKRILDKKWKALEKRGITRPRDEAEKIRRLEEASVGRRKGEGNVVVGVGLQHGLVL